MGCHRFAKSLKTIEEQLRYTDWLSKITTKLGHDYNPKPQHLTFSVVELQHVDRLISFAIK